MGDKYQMIFDSLQVKGARFNHNYASDTETIAEWDGLFEGSSSYFPAHTGGLGADQGSGVRYKKGAGTAITKEGSTWWLRVYYCDGGDCTKPAWIGSKTTGSDPSGYYTYQSGLQISMIGSNAKTLSATFTPIEVKRYCDCQCEYIKITLNFTGDGSSKSGVYMFLYQSAYCSYEWASSHPDNTGGMCTLDYTNGEWHFFAGMSQTHATATVVGGAPSAGNAVTGTAYYYDYSNGTPPDTDSCTIYIECE